MTKKVKAYIAGPDVFYPNAQDLANNARMVAARHDIEALIPIDNEIKSGKPADMSNAIFKANVKMINEADIVIANISPFRGPSADSGTVWEIGYAFAQGKKIFAFSDDTREYKDRVGKPDGMLIEDFGNIENLMIAHAVHSVSPTIEDAFKNAAKYIQDNKPSEKRGQKIRP